MVAPRHGLAPFAVLRGCSAKTCAEPGTLDAIWNYTYDGDGTRTGQSYTDYIDGTAQPEVITRYYFGGAYETTGSTWKKYYSFGGATLMRDADGFKYFLSDHLGSTSVVLSPDGDDPDTEMDIEQQRYLPFGQARVMPPYASVTSTDFTYTGQRNLEGTGLMDYKARFYSPALGRFIQPDTIIPGAANPQSWNRYTYVSNNPIRNNDPTGHCEGLWDCITPDAIVFSRELSFSFPGSKTLELDPKNIGLYFRPSTYARDYIIMNVDTVHISSKKGDDTGTPFITIADSKNNQDGNDFVSPQASFSGQITVLWGDVFKKKGVQAYSGDAYNTSACGGIPGVPVGGCGGLVKAVSDKKNNTRTPEDYQGLTVGFTLGFPAASFQTYPSGSSTNPSLQKAYRGRRPGGAADYVIPIVGKFLNRIRHHWDKEK